MSGRHGMKQARKAGAGCRLLVGVGAGAGVFFAAAAMATGSAVTAAPAHADFEDLLDPIIQPLLTSFTDSIAAFDPSAAADITSWTDSLLNSLGSIDLALPASADSTSTAAAAAAEPAAVSTVNVPITVMEDTEPTVGATVAGANTTLLVDSGSSGLVVPLTTLDGGSTNFFTELETLFSLGSPTNFGESGYSGGVDYYYLDYNEPVSYTTSGGSVGEATVPIEVEVYSYNPSDLSTLFTNDAFQNFDTDNDVTGLLGIGTMGTNGAGESPIEAAGYGGVTVSLSGSSGTLTLDPSPNTSGTDLTATGSTISGLTETVTNGSGVIGTGTVSDDLDSGGVYGTIPSSLVPSSDLVTDSNGDQILPAGDIVKVYDGTKELYQYTVATDGIGQSESPIVTSGTAIDSGVMPFFSHVLSIDYATGDLYYQ